MMSLFRICFLHPSLFNTPMSTPATPAAAVAAARAAVAAARAAHGAALAASLSLITPHNFPVYAQHRLAVALMDLSFGAVAEVVQDSGMSGRDLLALRNAWRMLQLPPQHGAQSSAQGSPAAWRPFEMLESSDLNDADFVEVAGALLAGDGRADRRGPSDEHTMPPHSNLHLAFNQLTLN
ncbi:hypothetical protein C8R47DRAFT_73731 [Mycena vitilis]|nr:hypothetical protein C8R47DRAFT_73731 [Mycena vitilis]